MKTKAIAAVALILMCNMSVGSADSPGDWKVIENKDFSFRVPPQFVKTDARGIDSFVEEYKGEGVVLSFDFGGWSNDFGDWPNTTKYESVKIDDRNARIGTVKDSFGRPSPYGTQVHFAKIDPKKPGLKLSMFASCATVKDIELAHKIFKSIKFRSNDP
jgi:hypothetical protein